jgi:allantoicase
MGADHNTPAFASLADLASSRVGGRAVAANDEFFAPRAGLVKPEAPVFMAGKFTTRGKWMDGWETRRRRTPGHDWCIVQLGMRGRIRGIDVNTAFFTGNFPSHCSLDAIDTRRALATRLHALEGSPWVRLLDPSPLAGDSHNYFTLTDDRPWTHVRLNIVPDGGVARLRVHGDVVVDWETAARADRALDLAAIVNGGLVLGASDMHFGAKDNMIMPGRAKNMGDGWETRRRRGPGFDWAVVRLGTPGTLSRVEIDTTHFKGNYPDRASLDGCLYPGATLSQLEAATWFQILPETRLEPHTRRAFAKELARTGPVSHVRLNIYPDGGISRLRVYGLPAPG